MNSVEIEGENVRVHGESQGYRGLSVMHTTTNCTVNGPDTPCMVTAWMPSAEDLAALNAGAPILIMILGTVVPPMLVEIAEVPANAKE